MWVVGVTLAVVVSFLSRLSAQPGGRAWHAAGNGTEASRSNGGRGVLALTTLALPAKKEINNDDNSGTWMLVYFIDLFGEVIGDIARHFCAVFIFRPPFVFSKVPA